MAEDLKDDEQARVEEIRRIGQFGLETASPMHQVHPPNQTPTMKLFDPAKVSQRLNKPDDLLKEYYNFSIKTLSSELSNEAIENSTKHYVDEGEVRLDATSETYSPNINNYGSGVFQSRVGKYIKNNITTGWKDKLQVDEDYLDFQNRVSYFDAELWTSLEGVVPIGYIPSGDSGLTFLDGFDLSSCNNKQKCLNHMVSAGIDKKTRDLLEPYMGKRGNEVKRMLKEYYKKEGKPLQLKWKDSVKLSAKFHEAEKAPFVTKAFNKGMKNTDNPTKTIPKPDAGDNSFEDLPAYWQAAVYAMGANNIWMKNFIKQLRQGDYEAAKNNLQSWTTGTSEGNIAAQNRATRVREWVIQKEAEEMAQINSSISN